MFITLSFDNATDDQLEEGLQAAMSVFRAARVDPRTAATAHFVRDGYEVRGYFARAHERHAAGLVDPPDDRGPSDDVMRLAALWDDASEAAHQAVKRALVREPQGSGLELANM